MTITRLFDVLEHIKEDTDVLRQIYLALKPGGYLLITVPQHQWLWSSFDVFSCHERRYSAKDLHKKIKHAGFEIIRSSSFVSGLLPVMYIDRISKKKMEYNLFSGLELNVFMNNFFSFFLSLDILLIRFGINLPLGGSRFVVAKKTI